MSHVNPANFEFIAQKIAQHAKTDTPKILDYGCGQGAVVKHVQQKGYDIVGCDTFEGYYENWYAQASDMHDVLKKMEDGKIPFPDNHFDIVVSNQVFEHIPDYKPYLAEIHRVLKPGGTFITLLPLKDTFYEGHAYLYFPHYLQNNKPLQYKYLKFCRSLGFGSPIQDKDKTPEMWATEMQKILQDVCFYHRYKDVKHDVETTFNAPMNDVGAEYLRFRGKRLKLDKFPVIANPLFRWITIKRAGIALSINKPEAA